jgi:hypothetical protein
MKLLTPKGFHNTAQGKRSVALGGSFQVMSQEGTAGKLLTPKGFHNTAQGKRSVALGGSATNESNPERVAQNTHNRVVFVQPFQG